MEVAPSSVADLSVFMFILFSIDSSRFSDILNNRHSFFPPLFMMSLHYEFLRFIPVIHDKSGGDVFPSFNSRTFIIRI